MTLHTTELHRQAKHYADVRQRLFATKKVAPVYLERIAAVVHVEAPPPPKPTRIDVDCNAHVKAYERRLMELAFNPMAVFIKDRCAEIGVTYAEVIGQGRRRKISMVRHQLMWETITKFGISYPALGRLFGFRDHTSCLYAVRKIEALQAASQ